MNALGKRCYLGRPTRSPCHDDPDCRATPVLLEEAIVYEGYAPAMAAPSYWHIHTLGEIFTALIRAGLQLRHFQEYPHSNREEAYDQYENRAAQLPMCFTAVALR